MRGAGRRRWRPTGAGWSLAVAMSVLGVTTVAVLARASGTGVPVPPAIHLGNGPPGAGDPTTTTPAGQRSTSRPSVAPAGRGPNATAAAVPPPTVEAPAGTAGAQSGPAVQTPPSRAVAAPVTPPVPSAGSPARSGTSHGGDGSGDGGGPPTTVEPSYPVVTATTTEPTTTEPTSTTTGPTTATGPTNTGPSTTTEQGDS